MKKLFSTSLLALCACVACSCGEKPVEKIKYVYTENEMYEKIWETKVIHNESIVLTEQDNGEFSGRLIYTPKQVISVRDNSLNKVYKEGTDYKVVGDRIVMINENMPHLTKENLSAADVPSLFVTDSTDPTSGTYDGKTSGSKILFTEGLGILMHQIMVTYSHEESWFGSIPEKKGSKLPLLREKLAEKQDLSLVTLGDSIFCGCNTSGRFGIEPYQDKFPDAFASEIKRVYGNEVLHTNLSKGGELSNYGATNASSLIAYTPDLLVVGFGMNDGSFNVAASTYKSNIETVITEAQKDTPDISIIVCATILPSQVSPQSNGNHEDYLPVLLELENDYENVAVMDMTTFSKDLFTKKYSMDLFANNINHPSDWLARQYVANLMNVIDK